MPRAKTTAALAGLVESDSEPDLDHFDAVDIQAARNKVPASITKKPRGRPAASNRVPKPSPKAARRTVANIQTENATPRKGKKGNQSNDEAVDTSIIEPRLSVESTRSKAGRGRPKATKPHGENAPDTDPIATGSVTASAIKRRGRPPSRRSATVPDEIPETQQAESMDLDVVPEEEEDEEDEEAKGEEEPDAVPAVAESGETLSGDELNNVALRRRLGDLTKKYDNLEKRHNDLREIGVKEAERNFERLRKQSEERASAANKLIAELKAELAAQTQLARQGQHLRKQLETSEANSKDLQATIDSLHVSLSEAKAEIKTLSTKLSASRTAEAASRVPGSALKPGTAANRAAQAEATQAAQAAQAKEDLYADLTGLIMRGIKREEFEDVFDCIQTGRNGTLHFKLAVENADVSESYEEVQFTYRPQLDSDRDGDLIDRLPDYLTEEITFPRPQASRFYARVVKSLTEQLE